jgi:hypothetical protein
MSNVKKYAKGSRIVGWLDEKVLPPRLRKVK